MMGTLLAAITAAGGGPPLEPDPEEARKLLRRELSKSEYSSDGNPITDFLRWLARLFATPATHTPGSPTIGFWISIGIGALALCAIAAIVIIVMLRKTRLPVRDAARQPGTLFGENDERSADEIRRSASAALRAGDFALATIEGYRALARSLSERTLVELSPGTTAYRCASDASQVFPDRASDLLAAAREFDRVRYLGKDASEAGARSIGELDARLQKSRPALRERPLVAAAARAHRSGEAHE